ncbi:MAG: peroxiredoxin family protein [Actinomycetota bacterium]
MSTKTRRGKQSGSRKGKAPRRPSASAQEAALAARARARGRPRRRRQRLGTGAKAGFAIGLAVLALGAIFYLNRPSAEERYAFQVGSPGPGQQAPPISLPSTGGGTFDLASMQGKTVLLYFQEGLMCQPCWDQLVDIERNPDDIKALGIDEIVSITTDPLDALSQKVADEGIASPVLSDPDLSVSRAYSANLYGMMGTSRDGHSFIVVGPDGVIRWRADYGGAPNFTMYVPVSHLLTDIRAGLQGSG